jgi:hypothetical protein
MLRTGMGLLLNTKGLIFTTLLTCDVCKVRFERQKIKSNLLKQFGFIIFLYYFLKNALVDLRVGDYG